jgi:predicted transport protein
MKLRKLDKIFLGSTKEVNEKWIQEQIAADPQILGLGDLVLRDKERPQPSAGRLDLLLQDVESNRRYEVELQLGKIDESHIIRTIEYWDIERKRYPQYDHCAVIIAEDITSRFLNVISLFNGSIPLIAIKMDAYKVSDDEISLTFTRVIDELALGLVDEDEEVAEITDRNYWIKRSTPEILKITDGLVAKINVFAENTLELKYNKYYIGMAKDGVAFNFVAFHPKKKYVNINIKLPYTEETQAQIVAHDLEDMGYDARWKQYRLRLTEKDIRQHGDFLVGLFEAAYANF